MVHYDKVLEFMKSDFPKNSIAYNACEAGAMAIEKVNKLEADYCMVPIKEHYDYCKLKVRFMQENLLKFEGGSPADWACYCITRFLNDYLEQHNVKDTDSKTEKRMQTVAFAHCLEDKLLDYIEKLEEFNND